VYEFGGSTFTLWDGNFRRARRAFELLPAFPKSAVTGNISKWQREGTRETVAFRHVETGARLRMHSYYFAGMMKEWYGKRQWPMYYLPSGGVRGKTILDVGAGEGETALFYLAHGASRVVAVENWPPAVELLKENVRANHWPVEVIEGGFSTSMLDRPHDFLKMDCELCESELLKYEDELGPASIESHSPELTQRLCTRFKMEVVYSSPSGLSIIRSRER
jgi:hypothetical protein